MGTLQESNWVTENLEPLEPPSYKDSQKVGHQAAPSPVHLSPPPRSAPPIPSAQLSGAGRMVLAIDYGTTFTGFAFTTTQTNEADLSKIEVIQEWTARMDNQQKVRSVISYAKPVQGEVQWGSDISADAISMVNTKLELEPQDSRFDELDLTLQVLRGMGNLAFEHVRRAGPDPEYTCRPPKQIVCDYLTKIVECVKKHIDVEGLKRVGTSVDIVATVPVGWSYQAFDALFKALRGAGFNRQNFPTLKDTILVSEPEAASYFTARDLRNRGSEFLKEDECFVLCDAGGGTVDVVSFQVNKVKPHLELEKATKPTGSKCGSSLIDTAFKGWLRDVIGRDNYAELDPANAGQKRISPHAGETGMMRELIRKFNVEKAVFANSTTSDIKLDLPAPLDTLTIDEKVNQGEVTIPRDEMKELMDSCVNGVIELILSQVDEVSKKKERRVRNVFLVGGFGASPYLQEELQESLDMRKKKMRRPDADKSLTAVVQGAVIYGIEKARHRDVKYMSAITKSYAVVREGREGKVFEWLIRKGDLVLSNQEHKIKSKSFWQSTQSCVNKKAEFPIYVYKPQEDEDDDNVPSRWQDGQHEVEKIGVVTCDFSNYLARDRPIPNVLIPGETDRFSRTKIGPLKWQLTLSSKGIGAEILLKEAPLAHCDIKIELDCTHDRRVSTEIWRETDDYD